MVELVVGLVALMVIFSALLLFARLGDRHTRAMIEARAKAGQYAMSDIYMLESPGPQFIYNWDEGADKKRYSADDKAQAADPTLAAAVLVNPSKPRDLEGRVPDNQISALSSGSLLSGMNLVHGHEKTEAIELFPLEQHLLYGADSVRVEADVWLSWTKDLQ